MKSLTKTIIKVFLALSIVFCISGIAMAYTFDSEVDPKTFVEWEVIGMTQTSQYGGFVVLKNPDIDAKIKEVVIEVFNNTVMSYEYAIEGKVYKYELNMETDNYDVIEPKSIK